MASNSNMKKRDQRMLALLEPDADSFPDDADDDCRPATSPYGGTLFQLYFKGQGPLYVPNGLLQKSPTFADRHSKDNILRIEDVSLDAGHVMVHFLCTGRYQCLKPEGQSPQDKRTAEFATSLRVFSVARVYRLAPLRDLATREIQRLGNGLSLPCILDVLHDVHHNLCDEDEWLETYLASRTRSELNALDRPRADALLLEIGCATTINKVLLRAVVNRELEEREALAKKLEDADRVLAVHRGLMEQQRKAGSARKPPSVDYIEFESPGELPLEAEEPLGGEKAAEEEKPAEDKKTPDAEDKPAEDKPAKEEKTLDAEEPPEEDKPAQEEDKPAEEDKPVERDKPAEEDTPAEEEEEYYKVAEEDFHPPAEVPPIEGYPNSGRGNDYCPHRTNFGWSSVQVSDFSNVQYYQPEPSDSEADQDPAAAGQRRDWQNDPLMRVPPVAPEPPAPLSKKDKKKAKKKSEKAKKKSEEDKRADLLPPTPAPPPPAEEEEQAYEMKADETKAEEEANSAEDPIMEVEKEKAAPAEAPDENWPWSVVSSPMERSHLANHLKSSGWRGCSKCAEYVSKLSQDLQDGEK